MLVQLLVTGEYPVLVYLAYLCAGLAIGRLDLTSRRVGWWLLGGGIALAVAARSASALLLYPLGGLDALISAGAPDASTLLWEAQSLLAEAESPISWWYLALPARTRWPPACRGTSLLGEEEWLRVTASSEQGLPVTEHLRRLIDGDVLPARALGSALVLSARGGDFALHLVEDVSFGVLSHTGTTVRLYVEEAFTFLDDTAEAAVVRPPDDVIGPSKRTEE